MGSSEPVIVFREIRFGPAVLVLQNLLHLCICSNVGILNMVRLIRTGYKTTVKDEKNRKAITWTTHSIPFLTHTHVAIATQHHLDPSSIRIVLHICFGVIKCSSGVFFKVFFKTVKVLQT